MLGTIVSEFPCYSFEQASRFTRTRLKLLFDEAQRQRAYNANLIALLVNKPNQSESDQRNIQDMLETLLKPHKRFYTNVVEDSWAELRRRQR